MKSCKKIMVIAAAVVLTAAAPGLAQEPQGSPITDLLNKGKKSLNDFNYRTADTVAHQLLALPLSRQQRIDVLQLLAATMYPDDAAEQHRDSAAAIIRQLVGMGVTRMVTRDITWPGLDALYASVAAEAPAITAAAAAGVKVGFDSVPSVLSLVGEGRLTDEIVERVNLDCSAFAFEDLDAALRSRPRAPYGLSDALKRTCSRLLVETDPPNASLTVAQRDLGAVPDRGHLRWVQPANAVEIGVSKGEFKASKTVDFPRGRLLHAKFFLPRDTLLWPAVRTPVQIAEELHLYDTWRPSSARPAEPVRPRKMNAFAYGMIWGLLGAGGGFAAGQFLPAAGCVSMYTVPTGETWRIKGKRYSSGESVNLGEGMTCTATIAGASGLGMMLFTSIIKTGKNRAANGRYADAVRKYPTVVKDWEDSERRSFAERNADVRQTLADQQIKLSQAQADNTAIRARNAQLPDPQIAERDLNYANTLAPANPSMPEVTSDVDMRVPVAAAPNPDAVAIVIGNRDYAGRGIPRVDFAVRDAKSMKRYLVEGFGFSEDRVILDTNVTSGRLSELFGSATDATASRLAELVSTKPAGTVDVFVFYSGLGAPDGRPARKFLVPVDANAQRLRATGYAIDQLYKNLTTLKARSVTVAIDAGFGALAADMFATESAGGAIEVEVGTVGGANTQVFTAGSADQQARWRRDQGHGLFTYFLLKGLQGYADANSDGGITAGELETYVKANVKTYAVERLSGVVQVPEVFTNNPDRVIVRLKGGT